MRSFLSFLGFYYLSSISSCNAQPSLVDMRSVLVTGFVDTEACYSALEAADSITPDRVLTPDEYALFVVSLDPSGILADRGNTFASLPLGLQSNFFAMTCLLCTPPDEPNGASCCEGDNARIETGGAFALDEPPTPEQITYLFLVCYLTTEAIDRVLSSPRPSRSPSLPPSVSPAPVTPTTPAPFVTLSPTRNPTPSPTPPPTTPNPTPSPSDNGVRRFYEAKVTYDIAILGGANPNLATPSAELIAAMDSLAPQVLSSTTNRKLLRSVAGRRLQTVQLSTSVDLDNAISIDCPVALTQPQDRCETVTATIGLVFQPGESDDPENKRDLFQDALTQAIESGDLQSALELVNDESVAFILTGATEGPNTRSGGGGDDDGISGGGVAGIVIGAASAFVLVAIAIAMYSKKERQDKEDRNALAPAPLHLALDGEDDEPVNKQDKDGSFAVLGATSPNYGNNHQKPKSTVDQMIMEKEKDMQAMSDHVHGDDSSNAGSSGWSSSQGVSSLNTGSNDGLDNDSIVGIAAGGATLAAMAAGAAGARAPRRASESEKSDSPSASSASRVDLDNALESGDWAAVGATAALLAAASDSQSMSSRSEHFSGSLNTSRSGTSMSSLDAARAAELDHLVDAGDWEGVVLAAAKYEAAEGQGPTESVASGSDSISASMTGSGTVPSVSAASETLSLASSPSKARKREELRAQVEELVRKVVPEEIENVDEMMLQFRGREEELVETLRTMQERAVAQKARQGAQKAAKIDAKRSVTEARAAPAAVLASAPADTKSSEESVQASEDSTLSSQYLPTNVQSIGAGQIEDKKVSPKATSLGVGHVEDAKKKEAKMEPMDRDQKQGLLEKAIEAGDWEAVGEAAALMSDASTASADSSEINRLAEGLSSVTSSKGSGSKGATAQRAAELDKLVDKGDWAGVVAAASRYNQDDEGEEQKPAKTKSWFGKQQQLKEQEEKRQKRLKRMQEEQDALEQAEIWMAIAEQTKQESEQEAPGASDAADWAIAKSLSLLVQAEEDGRLRHSPVKGDKPRDETQDDEEDDDEEEV